jgi:hypothetical protein
MRLKEFAQGALLEMLFSRKKAESVITSIERPLNTHLLKILAMPSNPDISHWRKEVSTYLRDIAIITLKPNNRPAPTALYYRILFDEPFGSVEVRNVRIMLQSLANDYPAFASSINELDVQTVAGHLQSFHKAFAHGCAIGAMVEQHNRDHLLNSLGK